MAPYVDERLNRTAVPGGYTLLGLQWHPKLTYRAEMTGVPINGYNTGLDDSRKPANMFEVDYWFGGLVAGGVAPQPEGKGDPGEFDVQVGRWIRRYRLYGHMSPESGGIQTLYYDRDCCHVQGDCEWTVCHDVVATELHGGSLGTAVVGLYVGAAADSLPGAAVQLPQRMTPDNSTVLVFHAAGVAHVAIDIAGSASKNLRVVGLSPVAATTVQLAGSWWQLNGQDVTVSAVLEQSGVVLWRRRVFGSPQTGQRSWAGALNGTTDDARRGRPPGVGSVALVFEKVIG